MHFPSGTWGYRWGRYNHATYCRFEPVVPSPSHIEGMSYHRFLPLPEAQEDCYAFIEMYIIMHFFLSVLKFPSYMVFRIPCVALHSASGVSSLMHVFHLYTFHSSICLSRALFVWCHSDTEGFCRSGLPGPPSKWQSCGRGQDGEGSGNPL